ncbi:hypothetical protein [Sagittula stellata]|uniref:Uncharacterized protein n=1 Tax=Sagittula stellata (strain ATCC 700073 / DSM 11524 / E-37) TaxID=388399 RepID=A3K2J1_SAGS3|nr:hypothetical protein [Sagittula stellata]EBA08400.1 hypothetical protein SSE37_16348 [Sagittula stellata E-37]
MEMTPARSAIWSQVGKALSHQIFDRFERFEDAVDEAVSGVAPEDRPALRGLLEDMLASSEDARALWENSGAGIAFHDSRGARMAMEMLLQAVKSKG